MTKRTRDPSSGHPAKCPICKNNLESRVNYYFCPSGHGELLHSKQLENLDELEHMNKNQDYSERQHNLSCPACSKPMVFVDYCGSGVIIDSCMNCHLRWLDSGEISKIRNRDPKKLNPEAYMAITKLDSMISDVSGRSISDPDELLNETLPVHHMHHDLWRRNEIHQFGMGIMGIAKYLLHSKASRIMITILLLFIAFMYIYTYKNI